MKTIELSMTTNYVNSWTFKEAIREILQNCIDQEIVNPDNKAEIQYDGESQKLAITNTLSTLDRESLLLGASTKSDDFQTVGKFGEGYKLALLVLSRLNYKVEILNYGRKEKWTPAIRHSKKFESDVLCIDIEKYIFTSVPDANLSFVIYGVTEDEYQEIVERTLQLQNVSDSSKLFSEFGEVLFDDVHAKSLFVNGLFICKVDKLTHGYNFKPQYINLDRDRSVVRDFDLFWLTSQLWIELWEDNKELVEEMIESDAPEVEYIQNLGSYSISDSLLDRFISKYGVDSAPVTNDEQAKKVREEGRKPVIVSAGYYSGITSSSYYYSRYPTQKVKTPHEVLQEFYDRYKVQLLVDATLAFEEIIEQAEGWEVK